MCHSNTICVLPTMNRLLPPPSIMLFKQRSTDSIGWTKRQTRARRRWSGWGIDALPTHCSDSVGSMPLAAVPLIVCRFLASVPVAAPSNPFPPLDIHQVSVPSSYCPILTFPARTTVPPSDAVEEGSTMRPPLHVYLTLYLSGCIFPPQP